MASPGMASGITKNSSSRRVKRLRGFHHDVSRRNAGDEIHHQAGQPEPDAAEDGVAV